MKQERRVPLPFHPLLFTLAPLLRVLYSNIETIPLWAAVFPAVLFLSLTVLVWGLLQAFIRDNRKSALIVSLGVFIFFAYRDMEMAAAGFLPPLVFSSRGLAFALFCAPLCIAALLGALFILKTRRNLAAATRYLNLISLILLLFSLPRIAFWEIRRGVFERPCFNAADNHEKLDSRPSAPGNSRPDIYYIILDAYAREDILSDRFGFDNGPFTGYLREKGFYIGGESRSNYSQTLLSLASSLNMEYIQDLESACPAGRPDRADLVRLLRGNRVTALLKKQGYTFISYVSPYMAADLSDLSDPGVPVRNYFLNRFLANEFMDLVVDSTPLRLFPECMPFSLELYRDMIRDSFGFLHAASRIPGPKFVFCHLMAAHPPFVLNESGNGGGMQLRRFTGDGAQFPGTRRQYRIGYTRQLQYVNGELIKALERILDTSRDPPVIILQADHGAGMFLHWENPAATDMEERFGILNAYYIPGAGNDGVYPAISPVNTFRFIFNRCFGSSYPMLEDKSYFSTLSRPMKFIRELSRGRE